MEAVVFEGRFWHWMKVISLEVRWCLPQEMAVPFYKLKRFCLYCTFQSEMIFSLENVDSYCSVRDDILSCMILELIECPKERDSMFAGKQTNTVSMPYFVYDVLTRTRAMSAGARRNPYLSYRRYSLSVVLYSSQSSWLLWLISERRCRTFLASLCGEHARMRDIESVKQTSVCSLQLPQPQDVQSQFFGAEECFPDSAADCMGGSARLWLIVDCTIVCLVPVWFCALCFCWAKIVSPPSVDIFCH